MSRFNRALFAVVCALIGLALSTAAKAAPPVAPGQAVYDRACAACHAAPEAGSRTPSFEALKQMSAGVLTAALTTGAMRAQGQALEQKALQALVAWLARPDASAGDAWIEAARCAPDRRGIDLRPKPTLANWGIDRANSRRMTASQAGLTTADLQNLEVAWTLALPRTSGLRSQPAIVGSTMFYAATHVGQLLALDTRTGCIKWATPAAIRTSLAFGRLGPNGPLGIVGGSEAGLLRAFDARTGRPLWHVDLRHDAAGSLTGSPQIVGDRILTPISATDVSAASDPAYPCCKAHGDLVALEAATGRRIWTYHTMEAAQPLGRRNAAGAQLFGPSGAPIWSSPSVDLRRGLVLTATGENTSPPATATSDAIVALDLATGKVRWTHQASRNDVWNMACPIGRKDPTPPGANCFFHDTDATLLDHDFGAGPLLFRGRGGRDLVLGGQKSGDVWALDIDTGAVVWRRRFGEGTALGGIHWGLATDGERVFAPVSDPYQPPGISAAGVHAVDAETGHVAWTWKAAADCGQGRGARVSGCIGLFGISAAPLVVDGAVLAGSLDGKLTVLDAATGQLLAVHDTIRAYDSHTGVAGRGGAIDASGVFAGDGLVFVNSGYSLFNQQPGNVLIAFRPKRPAPALSGR